MASLPEPKGPAPHAAVWDLCAAVAHALNRVLPKGFTARMEISVDGHGVLPHHVSVNLRPPQPRPEGVPMRKGSM